MALLFDIHPVGFFTGSPSMNMEGRLLKKLPRTNMEFSGNQTGQPGRHGVPKQRLILTALRLLRAFRGPRTPRAARSCRTTPHALALPPRTRAFSHSRDQASNPHRPARTQDRARESHSRTPQPRSGLPRAAHRASRTAHRARARTEARARNRSTHRQLRARSWPASGARTGQARHGL